MIEENFAKIRNKELTAGLADDIATGKKPIGNIPRADIQKYELPLADRPLVDLPQPDHR